jgi:hypothetical protein
METWKQIKGFKNYEISNKGRIKNISCKYFMDGCFKEGLKTVCFTSDENKPKTFMWHRLVATLFIENPLNKPLVRHRDGDSSNNKVSNLYWSNHKRG